ncbi:MULTISPECIES: aminodeoxychorismate lyase [Enterobacteriaceae]|uniref:Aminodeoxychorismate lyase n=1 Tax=Kluyvera genomosp. 2 TaxID=2774054 RepID=A0A2T2Y2Z2_9ENTR|nr:MULTISPECIES: aminodeoxychorismate lyase [Enterobacteriaceae]HAT3918623.1 aminodeoxychorismate lyase [Kluyvera ascorbata]PSR46915.1 aminodeoxychorismate lyase [Kluyvera genomosp. 2]BBQ84359.1 aminodeoxychorismate lyase [Klebsiella sp. WP3-W18-ESBL-02]BBR21361.1 aminodeoxychorismate lyase [Klebsiella sp. WP3-S18-ESBL-05]BBR58441.1 aminodeoxychorismate lyase [Klebsiella sp. WP4-W18-ESBL-05]
MFLINGIEQNALAAGDRATQFGDGCFTTARVIQGRVQMLAAHITRLQQACQRLAIPFTDWSTLSQEMTQLAQSQRDGVLKVILSRGAGGRGYSGSACLAPTRILSTSPVPAHYTRWKETGITLALSPVPLGRNPYLAGMKHLNRLEQVLIRSHLEQTDADEALVLDSDGWLTECCAANLFWRCGQNVYTPCLDQAGVNGIMRQFIIAQLALTAYRVVEVNAPLTALAQADEVLICNALMPVIPVQRYAEQQWPARELYQYLAPICESSD